MIKPLLALAAPMLLSKGARRFGGRHAGTLTAAVVALGWLMDKQNKRAKPGRGSAGWSGRAPHRR